MKLHMILVLCASAASGFSQTKAVTFIVITSSSTVHSPASKHVRALLAAEDNSEHIDTLKIKFHRESLKFALRGKNGRLTWFSYTNPPKDKKRISIEADQTSFGALLYRKTLYVCVPDRPQQSLSVVNELLSSTKASALSEVEAQSVALLLAKCSDTLQVYGDPQSTSESAQKLMQRVASPPLSTTANGNIKVEFYSWSALPDSAISKWSFLFRANRLQTVDRVVVADAAP